MSEQMSDYAATLEQLWPGATVSVGRPPGGSRSWLVVPSTKAPKLIVPIAGRAAATAVTSRTSEATTLRQRAVRWVLAQGLRSGLGSRALSVMSLDEATAGISTYLDEVFDRPTLASVSVGSRRANRKPVLQVVDRKGRSLGFVKIGLTDLAADLIETEAAALRRLATDGPATLDTPQVLHYGSWQGHRVLAISGLRAGYRRGQPDTLVQALKAVHRIDAGSPGPFDSSDFAARLAAAPSGADEQLAASYTRVYDALLERHQSARITLGSSHGDWSRWNQAWRGGRLQLWDWERFRSDLPLGVDAVHYAAFPGLSRIGDLGRAQAALAGPADELLARLGLNAAERTVATDLYLATMSARYLGDETTDAGAAARPILAWFLRVLGERLGLPQDASLSSTVEGARR